MLGILVTVIIFWATQGPTVGDDIIVVVTDETGETIERPIAGVRVTSIMFHRESCTVYTERSGYVIRTKTKPVSAELKRKEKSPRLNVQIGLPAEHSVSMEGDIKTVVVTKTEFAVTSTTGAKKSLMRSDRLQNALNVE